MNSYAPHGLDLLLLDADPPKRRAAAAQVPVRLALEARPFAPRARPAVSERGAVVIEYSRDHVCDDFAVHFTVD